MKHHAALLCSLALHLAAFRLLALVPADRPHPAPEYVLAVRLDQPAPVRPAEPREEKPAPAPPPEAGPAPEKTPPARETPPPKPESETGLAPAKEKKAPPPRPADPKLPPSRPEPPHRPVTGVTAATAEKPAGRSETPARPGTARAAGPRPSAPEGQAAPEAPSAPLALDLDEAPSGNAPAFFFTFRERILGSINYPLTARRRGWQGTTMVEFRVRRDGHLEEARVLESSGHDLLDRAALESVRRAAPFDPFPDEIKAEKAVMTITIRFRLS